MNTNSWIRLKALYRTSITFALMYLLLCSSVVLNEGCTKGVQANQDAGPLASETGRVLTWSETPQIPTTRDELKQCTMSWHNVMCDFGGTLVTVVRPLGNDIAEVKFEYRTSNLFLVNGREGVYWATTVLYPETYLRFIDEVLALCTERAPAQNSTSPPILFIDKPNGEHIAVPGPIPKQEAVICGGYGSLATDTCFALVHGFYITTGKELMEYDEEGLSESLHGKPVPRLVPYTIHNLSFDQADSKGLIAGLFMSTDMLQGKLSLDKLPGAFLDIYLYSAQKALSEDTLLQLWLKSSKAYRLAILVNLVRFGHPNLKARAAELLGNIILAERGCPDSNQNYLNDLSWKLLFAIEAGGALKQEWAYDATVDLLARDSGNPDKTVILFQWLPVVLLNYQEEHYSEVSVILKDRIAKGKTFSPSLAARPLAELAPNGTKELLLKVRADFEKQSDPYGMRYIDEALLVLGDRDALMRMLLLVSDSTNWPSDQSLTETFKALHFICLRRELADGMPGVPLGDRKALADWIVDRYKLGDPVVPTPYARLASPRYASWLLSSEGQNAFPRERYMEQLAWQTEPKAVEAMIKFLQAKDKDALAGVSSRWSPRFFPSAPISGHAEYHLIAEATEGVDWDAVRKAARSGSLHYYGLSNLNDADHLTILDMYEDFTKEPLMKIAKP